MSTALDAGTRAFAVVRALPGRAVIGLIHLYQRTFTHVLGARCRFHPSCSHYACQAVQRHGVLRGGLLSLWRILRCSPLSAGGLDPVPPAASSQGHAHG